jgi:DNA-binding transcriptional ArsR family regulator
VNGSAGATEVRQATSAAALPTLPVRVVLDPMPTVLTSLVEWFGPLRSRVPPSIRGQATSLVRGLDIGALAALVADPLHRGSPDFLTRLDLAEPVASVRDGISMLRALPEDAVLRDIDDTFGAGLRPGPRNPVAERWHRDPRRALTGLCESLDRYWHGVVMHVYPDIERRLCRATQQFQEAVAEAGPPAALALLHPRVRLDLAASSSGPPSGGGTAGGSASVQVTELVIKPMIANRLTVCTNIRSGPRVAAFAVATPGLTVAATPPAGDPLTLLIGPSRAVLLRRLKVRPATTTVLAEASGLGTSTVSHHLGSLRDAGVVAADRQGQCVLYSLTEQGHRLLDVA